MRSYQVIRGIGLLLTSIGMAHADSIDISGQEPWESCSYCHGFDGVSASDRFPHLAGQQKEYLKRQLQNFRAGVRSNDGAVMQTNAATLTDEQIEQVTEYFSQQILPASRSSAVDPALQRDAELLYRNGLAGECVVTACITCHGEQARGAGTIPALAGQHSAYLSKQLSDFSNEQRGQSKETLDHRFVRCLSAQQQQRLSEYLSTQ